MTNVRNSEFPRKLVLFCMLIAITLAAFSPAASAQSPDTELTEVPQMPPLEMVRAMAQPSIVYLETEYSARVFDTYNRAYVGNRFTITTSCSGFFVNPDGWIITAGHCAQVDRAVRTGLIDAAAQWAHKNGYYAADNLTLKKIRGFAAEDYELEAADGDRGQVDRQVTVWFGISLDGVSSGRQLPARIQEVRPFAEGDVTLLKIEADNMPALELAPTDRITVGTETVSIGYAGAVDAVTDLTYDPSFKEGTVSSKRTVGEGLVEVYETSSALTGGMSGGPTVNLDGQVIGLNSFTVRGESQAFNFVFPASIIDEVLREHGVTNEIGEVNETYRDGIAAYAAGDKETAVDQLNEVLDRVPHHELADEYLALAQQLPDPPPPTTVATTPQKTTPGNDDEPEDEPAKAQSFPLAAAGTGAGLLIAAIAAAMVLRRRDAQPTASSAPDAGDELWSAPDAHRPNGLTEQFEALAQLHAQGILSDEEFEKAKSRLLQPA